MSTVDEGSHRPRQPPPFWHGCLTITDDQPGERLCLAWRGWPQRLLLRLGLTLFLIAFFVVFFGMIWMATAPKLPPGWIVRFDVWWRLIAMFGLFGGIALFIVSMGANTFGRALGYWSNFEWDVATGEFRARFRGTWLGGGRRLRIPLSGLHNIILSTVPQASAQFALDLRIEFSVAGRSDSESFPIEIEHLDRRDEAMDFLFRIARIAGMSHYTVTENSVRRLEVRAVSAATKSPRSRKKPGTGVVDCPTGGAPARYDLDALPPGIEEPEIDVPSFNPSDLQRQIELTKLVEWQPGEFVRFLRPKMPGAVIALLGGIGVITGGVVGAFLLSEAIPASLWLLTVVGALAGGIVAVLLASFIYREREVLFDWSAGEVSWRNARWRRRRRLEEIESVTLLGTSRQRHQKHNTWTEYRTDLLVCLPGKELLVIGTDSWNRNADSPHHALLPLTAALAESLHVPWHWEEYTSHTTGLVSRSVGLSPPALKAALVVAALLLAPVLWYAGNLWLREGALKRLRMFEAQVTQPTVFEINGEEVLRDLVSVRFQYRENDDFHLFSVRDSLKLLPPFQLDLGGCAVRDSDLQYLPGMVDLRVLNLAETPVSKAGLTELQDLPGLISLNLDGTPTTDEGLGSIARLSSLRFISLKRTPITPAGIRQLAPLRQLEFLDLRQTRIHEAEVRELVPHFPKTKVAFNQAGPGPAPAHRRPARR